MFTRTRLLVALSIVAVAATGAFLLGPALFPGLDPSEEISKGSDAKIQAQDTSQPSSETITKRCEAVDGVGRTVYSDGAEEFTWQDGAKLYVEAPLERSDRSAIATYADGTVRMQLFQVGTLTREMPTVQPKETRWFRPNGDPRPAPQDGEYPRLWDDVAKFFPDSEVPDKPSPWLDPDWLPPVTQPEREDVHGPLVEPGVADDWVYEEYADGTRYSIKNDESGRWEHVEMLDGTRFIVLDEGDWRRFGPYSGGLPLCAEGEQEIIGWADGTRLLRTYPKVTIAETAEGTEPICETWLDSEGKEMAVPEPGTYPIIPWRFPPPRS